MDIQLFIGLVFLAIGFVSLPVLVVYLLDRKHRPQNTLTGYKARFNSSVYDAAEIERAFVYFEQEWLKRDPRSAKKLRKMLNKMNVQWEERRWRRLKLVNGQNKPRIVAAELTHSYTMRVWIGPTKKNRSIAYTGLTGSLVQATLYNLYGEVAEDITPFKPLILAVNIKLLRDTNVIIHGQS